MPNSKKNELTSKDIMEAVEQLKKGMVKCSHCGMWLPEDCIQAAYERGVDDGYKGSDDTRVQAYRLSLTQKIEGMKYPDIEIKDPQMIKEYIVRMCYTDALDDVLALLKEEHE